jgi:hypothetical protein
LQELQVLFAARLEKAAKKWHVPQINYAGLLNSLP